MTFEEGLLDYQEAERIRQEYVNKQLTIQQLAFKHALPYKLILKIINRQIFINPETPTVQHRGHENV